MEQVDTTEVGMEAIAEKKAQAVSEKKPWELQLELDHPELTPAKKEAKKEVKQEIEEEPVKETPKEQPEEKIEEKPAEEQQAEPEAQPAEEQPAEEAKPVPAEEPAKEEAYLAEYAKKNNITVKEAKEEVDTLKSIASKYKNDPVELAKAYRSTQSAYDKLKSEQGQKGNDPRVARIMEDPKAYANSVVKEKSEVILDQFKKDNPERSLLMTDGAILEEARDRILISLKGQINDYQSQLQREATKKRESLITGIAEDDKEFLPAIKSELEKFPDHMVASKDFNFDDLVSWARGKHLKEAVKKAEERGYQRGLQQSKILGEVGKPASTQKTRSSAAPAGNSLSSYEQRRAREMFGNAFDNDKDIFEAYTEVVNHKRKK